MHTLIAKDGDKWAVYAREHESVAWSRVEITNVLRSAIDVSLDGADLTKTLWTFSECPASEAMAHLLVDHPEQTLNIEELRAYVEVCVDRSLDIAILVPEGRFADNPGDRWASMHRPPRSHLWSAGLSATFRPQTLRHQLLEGFFGFDQPDEQTWKSFAGGKHGVDRPTHRRELWVRPAWRARALCPEAFPAFKPGPVITPEMEAKRLAKMPQTKSAVRRAQHAANDARFKAESAARRAAREQQEQA